MGVVFEARDLRNGRTCALKVLNRDKQESATAIKRFEREARSSAKLDHPNICAVYEFGEFDGTLYFTMELIQGKSLSKVIEDAGSGLPWRKACSIARDVALALGHAHDTGVLHRDVKPSNIIIESPGGRPKVVDFGLAREEDEISRLTRTGALLGTPAYMAPERFDKKLAREAGAPADIYALGITLYEMLSGKPPYEAESLYEILKLVKAGCPPPLEVPRGAPYELGTLVMKLIAREPKDRPASAAVVARALEDLVDGRYPSRGSAKAWIRRNPRAFLVLCASTPVLPVLALTLALGARGPGTTTPGGTATVSTSAVTKPADPPPLTGPAKLVEDARARFWAGDFDAAGALYDRVLQESPGHPDATCERALIPAITEDMEQALAQRPKLKGHEQNPVARVVLAAGAYYVGIRFDPGPVLGEERTHPMAPALLVLREFICNDLEQSQNLVREALLSKPDCGWIALRLGLLLVMGKKSEEALQVIDATRTYEGSSAGMRHWTRATVLEALGRSAEADQGYAQVRSPVRTAARARSRRAYLALMRGDATAAVDVHAAHEPGPIEARVNHGFALFLTGRAAEGRATLDTAVELADEVGDPGAIARAAGDGKDVLDACRALRRSPRPDANAEEHSMRARGMRGRFAARAQDWTTARSDLEKVTRSPSEHGSLDAVLKLNRGDFSGAVKAFVDLVESKKGGIPRDALLDFAFAVEGTGDLAGAKGAYEHLVKIDRLLAPYAQTRIAAIDAHEELPDPAVLVDEGASDTAMTGGSDGQGPRLYTGTRWVDGFETMYGFAPTIRIPQDAVGRVVEIDVDAEVPVEVHVIRGSPLRDEHAWWRQGFQVVARHAPKAQQKVEWTAQRGIWTVLVARVLPPGSEQAPVKLGHVKVTLRGPAAK